MTNYWLVRCLPATPNACINPGNWGNEARLTSTSFDFGKAPFDRGLFLGDYEGLASSGNDFFSVFSQPHGTDSASIFFRRVGP